MINSSEPLADDVHPLEMADRIDPGDEGSKCILTIDLTHSADLIRRMHSSGIEQEREIEGIKGQRSVLVRLLVECDKVLSTLYAESTDEQELLDRLRSQILAATAQHRPQEADLLSVRAGLEA